MIYHPFRERIAKAYAPDRFVRARERFTNNQMLRK